MPRPFRYSDAQFGWLEYVFDQLFLAVESVLRLSFQVAWSLLTTVIRAFAGR